MLSSCLSWGVTFPACRYNILFQPIPQFNITSYKFLATACERSPTHMNVFRGRMRIPRAVADPFTEVNQ